MIKKTNQSAKKIERVRLLGRHLTVYWNDKVRRLEQYTLGCEKETDKLINGHRFMTLTFMNHKSLSMNLWNWGQNCLKVE